MASVTIRQPLDGGAGFPRDAFDHRCIALAVRLARDVGCKQRRVVADAERLLKARAGGGNEPRRQRGRSAGKRIALQDNDVDADFLRGKRRAKSRRTRADNDNRGIGGKSARGYWFDGHVAGPASAAYWSPRGLASSICVQRNSAMVLPVASLLTSASQTWVVRPP